MAAYNEEKFISRAIKSILNQSYGNFEFIIINDFSKDNTLDIIKNFKDKRIILINNEFNLGLTRSLNIGIKIAKGEYIARMDSDDISDFLRFEYQVQVLQKRPKIGVVASWYGIIDEDEKLISLHKIPKSREYRVIDFIEKSTWFCHGSVMIRKKCLDKAKLYREKFLYAQDLDLWLRLSKFCSFFIVPQFLYYHRLSPKIIEKREIQRIFYMYARECALSREKNLPEPSFEIPNDKLFKLKKVLSVRDKRAYYHYLLGIKKSETGNYFESRKELLKAITINPFLIRIWYKLILNCFPKKISNKIKELVNYFIFRYNKKKIL
jgi:glycosyltransferase involved in cell wall biosynthesis